MTAMETEAAEVREENRRRYGPWTTAEIRIWENEEESAAMVQSMLRARQSLREEEEVTIQYLEQQQTRAREEQVALQEAEMAARTALERQRNEEAANRAGSEALDRISATCRGWMVFILSLHLPFFEISKSFLDVSLFVQRNAFAQMNSPLRLLNVTLPKYKRSMQPPASEFCVSAYKVSADSVCLSALKMFLPTRMGIVCKDKV